MADLTRLRELFEALLEVPAERWDEWLDARDVDPDTRSELRRLAAQDAWSDGLLDRSLGAVADWVLAEDARVAPAVGGRRIGPFRIQRRLGEGGMASVFLAERVDADFHQTVALKLLRHGALSQTERDLFRRERQVLARLSHPNIARLIDGGVDDDGVPYLAMEYVEGSTITRWCREHACDVAQRVMLVAKVARAVESAHAALVVHRDIKPSNVLVDGKGEPRLLDFGIAKLLQGEGEERTRPGLAPMTPEYAAPEQLDGGAITTATDVYALGVLLFELLTGTRPRRGVSRPASEHGVDPARTGPITRRRRDDLDTVLLKALAEEPALRYAGAGAFADDLERYVARQPVAAHPPSLLYRSRKFVQRHRGGVAVTVLLVLGILASLALALEQARSARREAQRAHRVQDFLVSAVEAARAVQPRAARPGIDDVVAAAAQQLEQDAALDPLSRAELLLALDRVARAAGDLDQRDRLLQRAREVADTLPPSEPLQWRLRHAQAVQATARRDTATAFALLDEAEALPLRPSPIQRLAARMLRANALYVAGRQQEAADLVETLVAEAPTTLDEEDVSNALDLRFAAGDILAIAERYQAAVDVLRPALAEHRARGLPPRTRYMSALAGLAQAEARIGNLDAALAAAEESLSLAREFFQPTHPHIARSLSTLGLVLHARGDSVRAAEVLREALALRRAQMGPDDPNLIAAVQSVGAAESILGRHEAALEYLHEARRICEIAPRGTGITCGVVRSRTAAALLGLGRVEDAAVEADAALAMQRDVPGERSPDYVATLALQAMIAQARGRTDEAAERVAQATRIAEDIPDLSRNARAGLGIAELTVLDARAQHAEALHRADALLSWWRAGSPAERYFLVRLLAARGAALHGLGRHAEARQTVAEARGLGLDAPQIGAAAEALLQRVEAGAG